ncbi:5'-3' exonuclease H3TH domain-containing protein [Streptomyces sp. DSM 44917]|uniref:5'-3' exonuclease n=1 Tax=Streptomyces boetiae TaxID=3075541 RepID=A0ABU2L7V1_9ACTN|nr:5'-3' exonuclease H3TH domain-containing protein [Streptomyces sp. DSM 44917]MDT0307653.1 5'-3' exonuclease H3TH domain-containing protein [Streptomyces sp. DSM 44917]
MTSSPAAPLLLVDGHNLLFRAWYGFPTRIRTRDQTVDRTGVFGFAALLRKAHRRHAAGHEVFVVFDAEDGGAARAEADSSYKAHRPAPEPGLIESLADIQRLLDHAGIRWIEQPGTEGDDVIATLATTARAARREVTVMSADKDFYQLLAPQVRLLNTMLAEDRRVITADHLPPRFGVTPAQWPDYRALSGDPADNIPGIRGIGPRTAARLLAGGRHLENIPAADLRPAWAAQWENVLRWREMIRLDRKTPLPDNPLTALPTPEMPPAAALLEQLGLW